MRTMGGILLVFEIETIERMGMMGGWTATV